MNQSPECPVDFVFINGNQVRITAGFILLFSISLVVLPHWSVASILFVDFSLRVCDKIRFSPLAGISGVIVKWFSIGNTPVDKAPKRFSAGIGLFISAVILVALFFRMDIVVIALALILVIFSCLESVFNFCAGCYVYTLLKRTSILR